MHCTYVICFFSITQTHTELQVVWVSLCCALCTGFAVRQTSYNPGAEPRGGTRQVNISPASTRMHQRLEGFDKSSPSFPHLVFRDSRLSEIEDTTFSAAGRHRHGVVYSNRCLKQLKGRLMNTASWLISTASGKYVKVRVEGVNLCTVMNLFCGS